MQCSFMPRSTVQRQCLNECVKCWRQECCRRMYDLEARDMSLTIRRNLPRRYLRYRMDHSMEILETSAPSDPRIKRTRAALCSALLSLLGEKAFDQIAIRDSVGRSD